MKNVLLISPANHDIYKDIIDGLNNLGFYVDFISDRQLRYDPYYLDASWPLPEKLYLKIRKMYWIKLLSRETYSKKYDYLFVVDGLGIHPIIFEILRSRNSSIRFYNYLYDTIKGIYRFDKFNSYYHYVYSFDKEECEKYNMIHLPIFWVPQESVSTSANYLFFAFGGYSKDRFLFFNKIHNVALKFNKDSIIKLYTTKISNLNKYIIKQKIRSIIGLPTRIAIDDYNSPLISHEALSPSDFRSMISKSEIVVDTHPLHQSGLTARFMWALGARKRIITTNKDACNYPFYSKEQICIVSNTDENVGESINKFITTNIDYNKLPNTEIDKCRIDNWLITIFELNSKIID